MHAQQRGVRAHIRRAVGRVVELDLGELGDLRQRRVGDRDRQRLAVAGELHRAHDERVRAPGGERRSRACRCRSARAGSAPPARGSRRARRAGRAASAGGAGSWRRRPSGRCRRSRSCRRRRSPRSRARRAARRLARALLDVGVVGGDRGLELVALDREQRRRSPSAGARVQPACIPRARRAAARGSPRSRAPGRSARPSSSRCSRAARAPRRSGRPPRRGGR